MRSSAHSSVRIAATIKSNKAKICVDGGCCLMLQAELLLDRGIHPLRIAEGYERACKVSSLSVVLISQSLHASMRASRPEAAKFCCTSGTL
jgi:hypothetical protein